MHFQSVVGVTSDIIDLQNMSCADEGAGGATCSCWCYGQSHANEGEQWYDDGGTNYQNDTITPSTNTDNYQMKWDALSGDAPQNWSTAEGVWESLDLDTFYVEWDVGGEGDSTGAVTVSIREGTGSVLDTAVWDGEAVGTKRGQ